MTNKHPEGEFQTTGSETPGLSLHVRECSSTTKESKLCAPPGWRMRMVSEQRSLYVVAGGACTLFMAKVIRVA